MNSKFNISRIHLIRRQRAICIYEYDFERVMYTYEAGSNIHIMIFKFFSSVSNRSLISLQP